MNIPKEIIEKAIEGGWHFLSTPVDLPLVENAKHQAVHVADIALDPTFWQALGKSLGWETKYFRCGMNCNNEVLAGGWEYQAKSFCNLIYTDQPTEAFWKELL
jgi:hypothetical protein